MKRFSIIAALALVTSILGIVGAARPAAASNGALRFLIFDPRGSVSGTSTLTYGEGLSLSAAVEDDSLSCFNYPHDCDNPTGTIDFWSQVGSPWVDNGPNQVKLSGDNVLVPYISELDPDRPSGISDADGGIYCCLHPADYLIRAYYVPGNFDPNSSTKGITVNKATPTISVEQSSTSSNLDEAVTLTATVSRVANRLADGPTGSVTFEEGDVGHTVQYGTAPVGTDGKASITTSQIPGGSHTIRAVYTGDTNYASAEPGTVTHSVARASTTSVLSASPTSLMFGQPITFTTTVSPVGTFTVKPTGTVTVDGTYLTASGTLDASSPPKAVFTGSPTRAGTQTVGASYAGDANFAGSSSNSVTLTVARAHTTTTVTTSVSPSALGQSVLFTASVLGDYNTVPTGSVQFQDGSTNIGTAQPMVNGVSTLQLSTLAGGTHTITAVYSGDNNHNGSSGTVSQVVTCDRVVSGSVASVDASGTTCLTNATVGGSVKVPAGAKLSLVNSTVGGVLSAASGAGPITICGTTVGGGVKITGAGGFVLIGDPVEDACAANALNSGVTLSGNTGGVELGFNRIGGSVSVTNNVGPGPGAAHASPEVQANNIGGTLGCSGNSPVVSNDGRPNSVGGGRSGECGAPGF